MSRAITAGLAKLREGGDFGEFVTSTASDFDRMSKDVFRRWRVPPGVDAEDVRQEMLLAFAEKELVSTWDPSKGPSLAQYAIWQSYTSAKRYLHSQRAASRRDGKAPSRFPLCFSSLGRADAENDGEERGLEGRVEATQEDAVASKQLAEGFRCLLGSNRVRLAFDVLRACGGDQESAVHFITTDPGVAMRCEVGSDEDAEELVRETVATTRALVREVLRT